MSENKTPDFITYPKTFEKYRWYKPILIFIIGFIALIIFSIILIVAFGSVYSENLMNSLLLGGYETMNNPIGQIFSDLSIIIMIPALYVGVKIVRDRPFSSYISSKGGWNFKLYLKALVIPFILMVIFTAAQIALQGANPKGEYHFSVLFLIACIILVPLQCITEEVVFRGFIMQTFGAWFKIPVVALILQAIVFTLGHGYNSAGLVEIFISGMIFGFFAWKTNGIEVSSAMHTANNFSLALFTMFGLIATTSTIGINDVIIGIITDIVICLIMYYVGEKTEWFGEIPQNS